MTFRNDSLLYLEKDFRFQVSVSKSKSKEYIYISIGSSNTNEIHFMAIKSPEKGFEMMVPRQVNHEYSVTDYKNDFYVFSNIKNPDFEVFKCTESLYALNDWKPFMKPKKGTRLTAFVIFDGFWVIGEMENMDNRLKIVSKETGKTKYIKVKEKIHNISTGYNPKFDSVTLRYLTSSMKSPSEVWNYNMTTGEQRLVKKQEVKNIFSSTWMKQKRIWAEVRDGTKIPITILCNPYSLNKRNKYKRMFMTS